MTKVVPVILAGGQGTRLWPMSRSSRPKQFLRVTGDTSLFQQTLSRVSDRSVYEPAIVITNAEYRFFVMEQAQDIGAELSGVLLEPVARNTAPAIAAATLYAQRKFNKEAIIYVLPSDHAVVVDDGYRSAVDAAASAAEEGNLVTFGVTPTAPETGYGYIEAGSEGGAVKPVVRFVEKPDLLRAKDMIEAGSYYWNSGMFIFKASSFLQECRTLVPEVLAASTTALDRATSDLDFVRLDPASFGDAPNISIDYAVFEKTNRAKVVPVAFKWSDLGSWDAVWHVSAKDENNNVSGSHATLSNTRSSLVISDNVHVVTEGLDDVVVIASDDAIFVGKLSEAQRVGGLVKTLKKDPETAPLTETHRTSYRPWGGYTSVLSGKRFQIKRIFVNPGKRLSLQKHHHRAEHWTVVSGTAEVTIGSNVQMLREDQSVYIPQGDIHRLANPGKILLELIEVQTGSYLGEDDIIRIEDEFGRA